MNRTKIVCTIGPACNDVETLKEMMKAGMDVARFNMSHGTHDSHRQLIDAVKQARFETGLPVEIMMDTRGPEIRIKQFKDGVVELKKGADFALTVENVLGDESIVGVTYSKLPTIAIPGTKILLNDGLIELRVVETTETVIYTKVEVGGELSNNKSISIPSVELNMDYLSKVDKEDIAFGVSEGIDCYSISFVNSAKDVEDVREYLQSLGQKESFIISKIESARGVENMDEIIDVSDGIMVARGDMGVEIDFEKLPHIQKQLIEKCNQKGKYTITATQMLESMIHAKRPTRAEISDVANAIYDGTSAIMLSGETSAGEYPVLVVETMQKIATETESTIDYDENLAKAIQTSNVTSGVGYAACALASSLKASAIIVNTNTGESANEISRFRPNGPIIALTPNYNTYFKLAMLWGVYPIMEKVYYDTDELLAASIEKVKQYNLVKPGDLVIQTTGKVIRKTGSNMIVVSEIGE